MVQLVIIADDLTGAADTGARFAAAGLTTVVSLHDHWTADADVQVVSTDSRNQSEKEAAVRVTAVAGRLAAQTDGCPLIYKKIDSTLRGHPAAELCRLMDAVCLDRAVIAPAFPQQGRTVVAGQLLVEGRPLHATSFGDEVATADVPALFRLGSPGRPTHRIDLETVRSGTGAIAKALAKLGPGLFVADAETDDDLQAVAEAARQQGIRLFCGSAGLAGALQRIAGFQPAATPLRFPERSSGPILVVAGSRHPRTHRQVEACGQAGILVIRLQTLGTRDENSMSELFTHAACENLQTTHRSPLTTHHPPLATHHSPLTTTSHRLTRPARSCGAGKTWS